MTSPTPTRPRGRHGIPILVLALLLASFPASVAAAVSPMVATVTPYPDNAEPDALPDPLPAFVTAGEYAAFDITVANPATSSAVTNVSIVGTTNMPASFSSFVVTHDPAGQVDCAWDATDGELACSLGNFAVGVSVSIRVIFDTPDSPGQTLLFSVLGESAGASSSDAPGQSRGDQFGDDAAILLVPLFLNDPVERGAAEFIPVGTAAQIRTAGTTTSPANPALTLVNVAPIPGDRAPFGTYGFLKEHADVTEFPCATGVTCHGQAVELQLLEGASFAPQAFLVEIRLDDVKANVATPKKWVIYHFIDGVATPEQPFDRTCVIDEETGFPTNAPCGVSRVAASDDKNDFIATFWLTENGYIRGG